MDPILPDYAKAILGSNLPKRDELSKLQRMAYRARAQGPDLGERGESRIGGQPDLPSDIDWPILNGKALTFIGQINFKEVPDSPVRDLLPPQGMLWFFYAAGCSDDFFFYGNEPEPDAIKVYFRDLPSEELELREIPKNLPEDFKDGIDEPGKLVFKRLENSFISCAEDPILDRLGLSELNDSFALCDVTEKAEAELEGIERDFCDVQILGHPNSFQYPVSPTVAECKGTDPEFASEEWTTLLEISDAFGDCALYFMIRIEDLKNRSWDKVWYTLQCT